MVRRLVISVLAGIIAGAAAPASPTPAPAGIMPRYTTDGALRRPPAIERWVLMGASLGLGYRDATGEGPEMFHRVYLEPAAYDHYLRTGTFREGTMLALALYRVAGGVPPSRAGWFEGEFAALELAVKAPERFRGGWAYFDFGRDAATARAFPAERCQACHAQHAANDNVFVQFYPTLRDLPSRVAGAARTPQR